MDKCVQVIDQRADLSSGEEEKDSSSSGSSADSQAPIVTPLAEKRFNDIEWSLAKGAKGMLHLLVDGSLHYSRNLSMPETGSGLACAATTLRKWSPRFFNALPVIAQSWWEEHATELPSLE